MFWIGCATGAFIVMLLIVGSMALLVALAAKERIRDGDKYKVDAEKLAAYWERSCSLMEEKNFILNRIEYYLSQR